MATKTWHVDLIDGRHTIELDHGTFSDKRVVRVDGAIVAEERRMLDLGSAHSFWVGERLLTIRIRSNGLRFSYELQINGESIH